MEVDSAIASSLIGAAATIIVAVIARPLDIKKPRAAILADPCGQF